MGPKIEPWDTPEVTPKTHLMQLPSENGFEGRYQTKPVSSRQNCVVAAQRVVCHDLLYQKP